MDGIRISKVEEVTLWRRGQSANGTLHLTSHHLIFSFQPPVVHDTTAAQHGTPSKPSRPRELWITYPMVSLCTYRPTPPSSHQQPSIRLRGRDFTFVAFHFLTEAKARQVYETIRNMSSRIGRLEKLYAFTYQAQGPEKEVDGWQIYDARREWARQGVGPKGTNPAWRITEINSDYQYSPTYPAIFPVPSTISDNVLNYAGRYRSRARIPALTYIHPINNCSITRSSQPLVGVRGNRSVQDERLVGAIFQTSRPPDPDQETFYTPEGSQSMATSGTSTPKLQHEQSGKSLEALEDEALSKMASGGEGSPERKTRLYGAQQSNLIVDARPTVNAFAMQAVGMGSENMDNYPFATKAYLGIDNIHVMRDSLNKVVDALKDSDFTPIAPARDQLARSGWLKHIANMLDGVSLIVRQIGIHHSHVLIHCSDGWDRTSQLSALSQICLDPYFRTLEGFIVLVEKDWVSFGHMFRHRSGFLGSEKWFDIEGERIGGSRSVSGSDVASSLQTRGTNALENALMSAKGFFNKTTSQFQQHHPQDSRESLNAVGEEEMQPSDSTGMRASPASSPARTIPQAEDKQATKVKETAPIFHQFLDAVYQIYSQHPTRFEFNERFLRRLFYQLYSCQYGTFLYDSEKARVEAKVKEKTRSVWDYFLARKKEFLNDQWDGGDVDDNVRGKERIILPEPTKVKWWIELFGRTDSEMNQASTSASYSAGSLYQDGSDTPPHPIKESALQALENAKTGPVKPVIHHSGEVSISKLEPAPVEPAAAPTADATAFQSTSSPNVSNNQSITRNVDESASHTKKRTTVPYSDPSPKESSAVTETPRTIDHAPIARSNIEAQPKATSTPSQDPDDDMDPLGVARLPANDSTGTPSSNITSSTSPRLRSGSGLAARLGGLRLGGSRISAGTAGGNSHGTGIEELELE